MPIKEFHDTILKMNGMPIEMLRAIMTNQPLTKDLKPAGDSTRRHLFGNDDDVELMLG